MRRMPEELGELLHQHDINHIIGLDQLADVIAEADTEHDQIAPIIG